MAEKTSRPISPHLQIYRPQVSWTLSIAHRIAGIGLSVGALF
ncbi:MAG: succinate dehydrogenase, cytochrome b556 subunit, partial [Alphaproteobacteria bacterium]